MYSTGTTGIFSVIFLYRLILLPISLLLVIARAHFGQLDSTCM
jgi:hypothetical protein